MVTVEPPSETRCPVGRSNDPAPAPPLASTNVASMANAPVRSLSLGWMST